MEDMIKAIGDNGLMIVISGVFLYFIVQLFNIGIGILKKKTDQEKHDRLTNVRADVSYQVQLLIERTLMETHADRIMVMEFKNGSANICGLPFIFMSCTYETFTDNLLPIADRMKDKHISHYPTFLTELQTHPYVILNINDRDDKYGRAIYELLVVQEESRSLCILMKSLQKIGVGYVSMKKKEDFTEDDINKLEDLSRQLAILLSMK
jgi:hypothetical protein